MNPIYHDLRSHRKKTPLTQQDVAELFGNKDVSQISRYETCPINPQTEISLLYHLLFGVPMSVFFAQQKDILLKKLLDKIPKIIEKLSILSESKVTDEKILFLKNLLKTLSEKNYD